MIIGGGERRVGEAHTGAHACIGERGRGGDDGASHASESAERPTGRWSRWFRAGLDKSRVPRGLANARRAVRQSGAVSLLATGPGTAAIGGAHVPSSVLHGRWPSRLVRCVRTGLRLAGVGWPGSLRVPCAMYLGLG